mmetsp:Transcript_21972/g.53922  ORF Transcript_21972/g.53922 Transcript_21972/m.53922 type:complete len:97 (-) Transcript_21972:1076-1366(-)
MDVCVVYENRHESDATFPCRLCRQTCKQEVVQTAAKDHCRVQANKIPTDTDSPTTHNTHTTHTHRHRHRRSPHTFMLIIRSIDCMDENIYPPPNKT